MKYLFSFLCCAVIALSCNNQKEVADKSKIQTNRNYIRASATLDSLYEHYGVPNSNLLRENYPFKEDYRANYLGGEAPDDAPKPYSYLWPYSGTLSAVSILMETSESPKQYKTLLDSKVLPGLEEYFDVKRKPDAYASYVNSHKPSDRFYDDNVWLGIDFADIYMQTNEKKYLDKAKMIWEFIRSGTDDILGGGIYWRERGKSSKNTCSNAPGAVYAFKLFEATKDSIYFREGLTLYNWTKESLQDDADYLYFDNIDVRSKRVDKTKYAYNSGQMLQAAVLLYNLTKDEQYLTEAKNVAESCYNHFFHDYTAENGGTFRLINKGNVWFTAVMFRGFEELYKVYGYAKYIDAFQASLDYAWEHSREANGLFNSDWSGREKDNSKNLLTQAAIVEMYARMAKISE